MKINRHINQKKDSFVSIKIATTKKTKSCKQGSTIEWFDVDSKIYSRTRLRNANIWWYWKIESWEEKKKFRNSKSDNSLCAVIKFKKFNVTCNFDIDMTLIWHCFFFKFCFQNLYCELTTIHSLCRIFRFFHKKNDFVAKMIWNKLSTLYLVSFHAILLNSKVIFALILLFWNFISKFWIL